ncbi:TPA: hypothetical protein N0F65_007925 [Lagenidium giganteum]|uniref:LAGLIDADG homing endonuclease n=1 Tax=Lagenidium giganteum TaxID=4803 RepID=A0AAV2YZ41_9STRA|nr:TPA: hypothetical protein N0F65_007925 [Lagenidium giganteum]
MTGKTEDVEYVLQSLRCQQKCCKKNVVVDFPRAIRGRGERKCYMYALPDVGLVKAFQMEHANTKNSYASYIDRPSLVKWYEAFALKIGTVVPVRFRRQKTKGGIVSRYHTKVD